MEKQIKKGSKVNLHFIGKFDDGEIFENSYETESLAFEVGKGEIIKGFETAVMGLKAGDKKTFAVGCEDAYGLYDEELVVEVPKTEIPDVDDLEVGAVVFLQGEEGEEYDFVVQEISGDIVLLDGNHPLAGEDLNFEIEILTVD